jgi:tRNA A22 N-methylase
MAFFQEIVMPTSDKLFFYEILHAEKHRKQKKVYDKTKSLIYGELKVKKAKTLKAYKTPENNSREKIFVVR